MTHSSQIQTRVLVSKTPSGVLSPFTESVDVKLSSHGAPWDDAMSAELDLLAPGELEDCYISRTTIAQPFASHSHPTIKRLSSPSHYEGGVTKDVIHIDPKGALTGVRWTEHMDILFLMPSEPTFQRVLRDMRGAPSRFELTRTSYAQDTQIRQIGLAVLAECQNGFASGRIFGESLAIALAARLVTCYSSNTLATSRNSDGLPTWRLRRVTDFIEENLDTELSLADIAEVAGFSEFHFSRLFKSRTGLTPHRYVIQRRINKAKELLKHSQMSIKEISANLGFSDQAHFTTVFKNIAGTTPKQFREQAA